MKIKRAVFTPGKSAFFFDDQAAIKGGAVHDGFIYRGEAVTPGFKRIRQAGEAISVCLLLGDGQLALGDCVAVQYSGSGGRDPLFLAEQYMPLLEKHIRPLLEGRDLVSFKDFAGELDQLRIDGQRLHTALRYGLSQAILDATAKARAQLMVRVICEEYQLPLIPRAVPIFAQSGDDRHDNVDKMIIKEVDVLPHGLINNVDQKLGRRGEKLESYVHWLVDRIRELRGSQDYEPVLHIDVYGTLGIIFDCNPEKIAAYLRTLERAAGGFQLYIEEPVDMGAREEQIAVMRSLLEALERLGCQVKIVADEWCNTLEDIKAFSDAGACHMAQIKTPDLGSVHNIVESIIYCKKRGVEAYQGGSCNETDISARTCVHIALAARAERMLAKPGMGFDEGYSVVRNEMERTLGLLKLETGGGTC